MGTPNPFRIVLGSQAERNTWPWQASLKWQGWHSCGASLINDRWLLTGRLN
jgi:hypothetical protein